LLFLHGGRTQFVVAGTVDSFGDDAVDFLHAFHVVLLGDAQSVLEEFLLDVDVDCFVLVFALQQTVFSFRQLLAVDVPLGLGHQDFLDHGCILPPGDLQSIVPVLLELVHVDGFLRPSRLDLLLLSLLELLFVFQLLRVFEVDVVEFVLGVHIAHGVGFVEVFEVDQIVDGRLSEAQLHEQFDPVVFAHGLCPALGEVVDFLRRAVSLDHPQCFIPELVALVHFHGIHPGLAVHLTLFGLEEVAVRLLDGRNVHLDVLQQVLPLLLRQSNHVVLHFEVPLHVDGLVLLAHLELQHFRFLEFLVLLLLLSVFALQRNNFVFRQISGGEVLSTVLAFVQNVHLECIKRTFGLDEQFLCLLELLGFSLVLGNLFQVGSGDFGWLVGEQVESDLPLATRDGRLYRFAAGSGVNLVGHC